VLGDAGYHTLEVLSELAAREIDVLIPAGRTYAQPPWEKRQATRKLAQVGVPLRAEADVYHCRANVSWHARGRPRPPRRRYMRYRGDCRGCGPARPLHQVKDQRVLKRYAGEKIKEAMAAVLQQPAALRSCAGVAQSSSHCGPTCANANADPLPSPRAGQGEA